MKYTRYCRSVLMTPATAVGKYAKAHRAGADICLVDLEDSVPLPDKAMARAEARTFFSSPTARLCRCGIRINAITDPHGLADLLALREYPVKPVVVLIPKVEAARDVEIVESVLGDSCPDVSFFVLVETPRGIQQAAAIARSSRRLRGLVFGSADYAFSIGAGLAWENLLPVRARLVNDARAAGIEVIDAPLFDIADRERLCRESMLGRELGFSGKIALHPGQVTAINEAYAPTEVVLDQARRIILAAGAGEHNIALVEGRAVGRPFFEAAQRLLHDFETPSGPAGNGTDQGESAE